jgi:CO/xanthine dehydrogenase FAD-binding subunit
MKLTERPVVTVTAAVTRHGNDVATARLIVGSVGSVPFAADTAGLAGDAAGFAARAGACAEQAAAACAPLAGGEASPGYLRHLVAVHARQALGEAFAAS